MADDGVIIDQWVQEVKDTAVLTVFPTPRLVRSRWGPIFTTAITTFNTLSGLHKLGVTLKEADQPPDSEGFKDGGANIQFDFSGGDTSFKFRGTIHPPRPRQTLQRSTHSRTDTYPHRGRQDAQMLHLCTDVSAGK